ncbi:hypothetical protein [Mycolicibacterium austroafricanum]|uniref:hypothetical protein n=1 Tax=Mycolicibacterium austroafricanum TaxID=39687 RepID=UPI001CA32571|nr:hypothetical protein [Mycolicibacterium austroafricanum]QZT56347.1 hypothetical protein JN084_26095 [Mycolicibacterium austroafricanum]QZT56349.1 hypothetical protein JN084_26105 [Mycolicibacterium austroafricanum]
MIDLQEQGVRLGGTRRGPRVLDIAVHVPDAITRSYAQVNRILNRIGAVLLPMKQVTGSDGVRVICI